MEENRIPEELEAQELCLMKHNELEQLKDEDKSQSRKQMIETLQDINKTYPHAVTQQTLIKSSAYSSVIQIGSASKI